MSVHAKEPEASHGADSTRGGASDLNEEEIKANLWSIRPCHIYKEEYDDCSSMKGRFHQYFIHGESIDCLPWKRDYDSCVRFERNPSDLQAAQEIIASEEQRRTDRLRAHYQNTVWTRRKAPPSDWKKPLPEWLQEKNRNTYLEVKANEMLEAERKGKPGLGFSEERTLCVIM